jgi:hypothetical protein
LDARLFNQRIPSQWEECIWSFVLYFCPASLKIVESCTAKSTTSNSKMAPESFEMEPLKEKLLRRSLDDSFSDTDNEEDDIIVHGSDSGPSNEDRQLLNEEDEREKLLTRKRNKVLIGSSRHARKQSVESQMEDGTLRTKSDGGRSKVNPDPDSPDRRITDV